MSVTSPPDAFSSTPVFTTLIDAANLAALIVDSSRHLCIVDCRADLMDGTAGARAFAERHLPGARFMDLVEDLSGPKTGANGRHPLPDRETLAAKFGRMGIDNQTQIIAYDALDGRYAARLWWLARWLGHDAVAVLDGGFQGWENGGGLVEFSAPRAAEQKTFVPGASLVRTVDTDAVVANLQSKQSQVVDARAPDRFRGENETIDPVGGHIPGAINRFFGENLETDGRFKTADVLHREFTAKLPQAAISQSIMQCGSGVTACHNLLALEVAGLPGASLYPGSWSEWSTDKSRPIATGAA